MRMSLILLDVKQDLVEVVRCKDCKWCEPFTEHECICGITTICNNMDFYCANGEKEQNDE